MKKVLAALVMVLGTGSSVVFAQEVNNSSAIVAEAQVPQDEFVKIDPTELPQAVMQTLAKDYEGASVKEAYVKETEETTLYKIIIVTNQSGVPRGLVQIPNLNEIHRRIRAEFARHAVDIAGFYYAQFLVESNHRLRKPNPGMLLEATNDHGIDLSQSWMVGDRMTDVEAGHRAGTRSIFLRGSEEPTSIPRRPEFVANDLYEVADFILNCP